MFTPREISQFRLSRAIKAAAEDGLKGTYEAELLREATERNGTQFTPNQFFLPFELMRRDLTTATAGHLVSVDSPFALDVLRPGSAVIRAGAQVLDATGDIAHPVVRQAGTAYWLAGDGTPQITPTQTDIGAVSLVAKNVAALTTVSGKLMRQAAGLDAFIQREMTRTIGQALDLAVMVGSGVSGEPQGIHNTDGIDAVAGASLDWADVTGMVEAIQTAKGTGVSFFGTPAVKKLLSNRERIASGGRAIWDDGRIDGYNALALSNAPTGTLTAGDFTQVLVAVFGDGLEIVVDPYTGFSTGAVSFRAWLTCDIGVSHAGVFSVATSVS